MRLAALAVVALCVLGVALAAPQVATDEPLLSGAFGDDDTDPAYGPVESSYFRVMGYDRYTGSGWERTTTGRSTATLEAPPGESEGVTVAYEVAAPVRTLPAPWRPTAYDGPEAAVVDGSLEPTEPMTPGEEFEVTSRRPVWTDGQLRAAGTDYPAAIERRYTQLPAETPPALGELAEELTADADTPYGAAVAVDRWLRTEKNYSLAVDRPEGDVATAFGTEMAAGYCEYFATTMVGLLRSEGIPARYVTGYTPYEQVGAGEHVIRGKYAHTWTEVYFPGVGWVPFDPTPRAGREAARGLATAEAGGDSDRAALRGAIGRFGTQSGAEGYRQVDADIELEGAAVPGTEVTVAVSDPDTGAPLSGVQVRFNGRPVGETDAAGSVRATVPFSGLLTVSTHAYEGEGEPPPVVGDETVTGEAASPDSIQDLRYATPRTEVSGSIGSLSDEVLFRATVENGSVLRRGEPGGADGGAGAGADGSAGGDGPQQAAIQDPTERFSADGPLAAERTFQVNTTINVTLQRAYEPEGRQERRLDELGLLVGKPLRVTATIEGVPVADATVRTATESARTDGDGVATVPVPFEDPATVVVERGDASGEATVETAGRLRTGVDLEEPTVAGQPVTVRVSLARGDPVEGATVTNGVETARTGADGVARIPAPYRPNGRVVAAKGDLESGIPLGVVREDPTVEVENPVPGRPTGLEATLRDVPFRNATVELDGREVGRTDDRGRAAVRLPYSQTATVAVGRGGLRTEHVIELPTAVRVETDRRALPGRTVGIRASVGGEAVENGTVLLDGEAVATTDAAGEATVSLPVVAGRAQIRVERGAASGATTVSPWPYWAAGAVALVVAVAARRLGYGGVVARCPAALLSALRRGLAAAVADARRTLARRDAGVEVGPETTNGDAGGSAAAPLEGEPAADNDVYRAWAALVAGLEGDYRTPAAAAEAAVERGLPAEPVAELTDLFREVRYSDADPTAEREQRAAEALEAIREAT